MRWVLLLTVGVPTALWAQVVSITDGATYDQCQGAVCDPGGPHGGYPNGTSAEATLCPSGGAGAGPLTQIRFVDWNVAPGPGDQLRIFQGTEASGAPFLVGSHTNSLQDQIVTSAHASGCLTFSWQTDAVGSGRGWRAVVMTGPQAGADATAEIATTAPPFQMLDSLCGFPQPGGSWTGPGGGCDGTFDPDDDPYGAYFYTVTAQNGCPGHTARLFVQQPQTASAGTNGVLTLCATDPAVDLFDALGGNPDPGGVWTDPDGDPVSSTFNPAVDAPGVYTYTVPCAPQPCVDPTATVTVSVNQPPSAGTNATTAVCSNGAAFNLFTLLGGSPQAGGAWTGPGGAPVSSTFTPGTSAPGVYTYTVLGAPPCANASATVTVSVVNAPNAGAGTSFTVCSNAASFALITRLGGTPQPGGSWAGPGGAHGPTFVPGTDVAGVYTYTVIGTAPCANATASLTIGVQAAPNAGTNASTTVCSTD
ncbi:MAG: hypothetical protein ACO1NQ_08730, partial [Flavobacteriales bacterium]